MAESLLNHALGSSSSGLLTGILLPVIGSQLSRNWFRNGSLTFILRRA